MRKILHISKYYPPYSGGIEDVCYNVVHCLAGVEDIVQKVICFNNSSETIYDTCEGVDVVRVGTIRKIARQALSIRYRKELKKLIRDFKPDVVHFHAPNPLISYYLCSVLPANVKLIVHWHSDIVAQKILYRLIRAQETKLLRRANVIIATSPNYITNSKPLQSFRDKTVVIQNIIDPSKFEYTECVSQKVKEIKNRYDNKPILLFVGRHVEYKGLQYLLEALKMITNQCEVVIGGKGPLTHALKAVNNSSNIHFVGRIPENELAAYYYAADIFVFPSITKNEAFGVVLAEAMYCNTAAITFTIEGSGVNWVNMNTLTGIEVENSNSCELAMAIDTLLTDDNLRLQYASQARKRVEELFTINCIKEQLIALY